MFYEYRLGIKKRVISFVYLLNNTKCPLCRQLLTTPNMNQLKGEMIVERLHYTFPLKYVAEKDIEPSKSGLSVRRSTDCATRPERPINLSCIITQYLNRVVSFLMTQGIFKPFSRETHGCLFVQVD